MLNNMVEVIVIDGNVISIKNAGGCMFICVNSHETPRYKAVFSLKGNTVKELDTTYPKYKHKEVVMDVLNNLPLILEEIMCLQY